MPDPNPELDALKAKHAELEKSKETVSSKAVEQVEAAMASVQHQIDQLEPPEAPAEEEASAEEPAPAKP